MWSAARSAKISMILCMPERVSGGDAKFQGFCDGWNKWEGQVDVVGAFQLVLDQNPGVSADIFAKDVGAEAADRFLLSFQFQIDSQGFSQDF